MKSNPVLIVILIGLLLLAGPVTAETFPNLEFERVDGTRVELGADLKKPCMIIIGKTMPKHQASNNSWLRGLKDKLGSDPEVQLYMVGDLSGRPPLVSKDLLKKKLLEKSQQSGNEGMRTHMLLDWDGQARNLLAKDAQHYVYLLDKSGTIVETVVGVYELKKVEILFQALETLP